MADVFYKSDGSDWTYDDYVAINKHAGNDESVLITEDEFTTESEAFCIASMLV